MEEPWGAPTLRRAGVPGAPAYPLVVFFLFFFFSSCVICFRYKTPYAALAMKRKQPISPITTARFTSS